MFSDKNKDKKKNTDTGKDAGVNAGPDTGLGTDMDPEMGPGMDDPDLMQPFVPDEQQDPDIQRFRSRRDFARGVITGALIAGILVMAGMLFRFGTVGGSGDSGARILTQEKTLRKLASVQQIIDEDYLWDVDSEQLESFMFRGIAVGLNDPYAAYYTRDEEVMAARENQGSYTGIGVVFTQYEEKTESETQQDQGVAETQTDSCEAGGAQALRYRVVISDVYENSPAMEAGLTKGDVLMTIAGENVEGNSLAEVMMKINQAFDRNETIRLGFLRGDEPVEVKIREDEVMITQISGRIPEKGIGYILIPEFSGAAPGRFREMLAQLEEEAAADGAPLEALILDVRDNPGGNLESVTEMLDDLLDSCVTLTSSNAGGEQERFTAEDGKIFDGRMAVLVNGGSASAAEVFAGALQYYDAAKLVGQTTYGKGTVQHTYTLSDGSAFKLTSEKYAVAGENEIDGAGITPDVEVPDEEDAADAGDAPEGSGEKEEDRVLAAALDLLKNK